MNDTVQRSPALLADALAPLVFVLVWSTGFIVAKFGLPYSPPLTFLLLRYLGVIVLLLPTLLWPLWRMRTHWQRIWVAGICTMVITSVAGWWYWRNALLYGDVFGLTLFRQTYQTMVLDLLAADTWRAAWQQLVRSAWGVYGWMTIPAPSWWYLLTATITIAALCGVVKIGRAHV